MSSYISITPQSANNIDRILDLERYNGRVNIIEPPNPDARFQMAEKISIDNRATDYRDALTGLEDNVLAQVYFSKENVQIIQNGIRAGVYNKSDKKFVISPQNIDTIKIIMQSIYMQYAKHYEDNIKQQVTDLNKLVLEYAINDTYNAAMSYLKYCEDQSTLVVPIKIPIANDRQYKQLELKPWF
jgi:citrate lyase gamma subunit